MVWMMLNQAKKGKVIQMSNLPLKHGRRRASMNRINIITLGVRDITESLRFYRDGLGFRTLIKEDDPAIVFFK